ncbi:MAG: hypothetical protein WC816_12945 [Sphingomonas sp.]|jgi:hypothetical protein
MMLTTGTNSNGANLRPHESQLERPVITDRPSGQRITNAAMKLRRIRPSAPNPDPQMIPSFKIWSALITITPE